jgi:ferredoxin
LLKSKVGFRVKSMEKVGERIKGSKFLRDFCTRCGEPIRVASVENIHNGVSHRVDNYCTDCYPRPLNGYSGEPLSEMRYNGYAQNR